jgi:hypothetical protein
MNSPGVVYIELVGDAAVCTVCAKLFNAREQTTTEA